jgi:DNA-binding NarL/FixJ family response regulator
MKRITVLLADDHTIVREGLRRLLEAEGDIQVVAEADTGRKAVELARTLGPAVVIMDIAMPGLNGLEATRQILKANRAAKVLILSAHGDPGYVDQVMKLGAAGYLLKYASARVLCRAVREVDKGCAFLFPAVSGGRPSRAGQPGGPRHGTGAPRANLSGREVEVLQLIAEGYANKQVAAELSISVKTVEKHRQHLMEKLEIHDTAGLTRYALRSGIIESGVQVTIV